MKPSNMPRILKKPGLGRSKLKLSTATGQENKIEKTKHNENENNFDAIEKFSSMPTQGFC